MMQARANLKRARVKAQPKLEVGKRDDPLEREADRNADRIRHPLSTMSLEGKMSDSFDQADSGNAAREDAYISGLSTSGKALGLHQREFFETRFGYDFSNVRIHADEQAGVSAQRLGAHAYTHGNDIVFGPNQFSPETPEGRSLLAHELTHVVQQRMSLAQSSVVRRQAFGPEASGAPATWAADVRAAATPAAKAALLQVAMGLTVTDNTAASAGDASPTASHLVAYTSANPAVNYDDNLATKRSHVDRRLLNINAGYTLHAAGKFYIVFGPKALKDGDFFWSRTVLNHELDHVRQDISGSTLQGHESELDAWTGTFIRDFHRSYILKQSGSNAYVDQVTEWLPLLFYYGQSDVDATQKDKCVARITAYYNATIRPHAAHNSVFRFWIHRSLRGSTPELAQRLNTDLNLGIDPTAALSATRQFPIGTLRSLTYPTGPTVDQPAGAP